MYKKFHGVIVPLILIISLLGAVWFTPPAQAWVFTDWVDLVLDIPKMIGTWGTFMYDTVVKPLADMITANTVIFYKIAALLVVQQATKLIIGSGDGAAISDFKQYLYIAPQQRAMAQMNTFFNTVSRGRYSNLNYEGIGPNYDAYLIAQARQAIGGQNFVTNLQDQVTDPKLMFAAGNMKGITSYMQCANNVMCYTLTATAKYNEEFAKAQDIARSEQDKGILPKKEKGKIIRPAALIQSALLQSDQLGTQVIMNAEFKSKDTTMATLAQIASGSAISIASRSINYYTATDAGKQAIRNKNDEFPFSLSYTLGGGVGVSAGGVSINTGIGEIASQIQIGNTCAVMYGSIAPDGAQVTIQGRKYTCPKPGTTMSGTAPSAEISFPKYSCTPGPLGDGPCAGWFGSAYKCGSEKRCVLK